MRADPLRGVSDYEVAHLAAEISRGCQVGVDGSGSGDGLLYVRAAIDLLLWVKVQRRHLRTLSEQQFHLRNLGLVHRMTPPWKAEYVPVDQAWKELLQGKKPAYWKPKVMELLEPFPDLKEAFEVHKRVRRDELPLIRHMLDQSSSARRKATGQNNAKRNRKKVYRAKK